MTIPHKLAAAVFVLPWFFSALGVGWVVKQRFPPGDIFVTETALDGRNPFINPFLPAERANSPGLQSGGWTGQRITADPVYFTTRIPGPYSSVEVEIDFRPLRQPLLEFGLVRDPSGKALEMRPMYSSELQLPSWSPVTGGFTRDGVETRGVAVWFGTSTMPRMTDVTAPAKKTEISLRGAHDFYLVPTDKKLDVIFGFQDVNRKKGASVISLRVFKGENEIHREAFTAGGILDETMNKVFDHKVLVTEAEPDVYRISVGTEDDVFIRTITTPSRKWVVGPRLNFGDVAGYAAEAFPAQAWTNSRHIVAETFHHEGLQPLTLGKQHVQITRTHEAYRLDRNDTTRGSVKLFAPKGDVRVIGDGWFALREEAFFEPKPPRLTDGTDLIKEAITTVITPFHRPEDLGEGWYRARFSFPIEVAQDGLRFVLSAPGLASRLGAVDVRRIGVTYRREHLPYTSRWKIFLQDLRNAWRRL